MVIQKVINNNVISAYDENQQEVVIMGKGIGFKAHTGDAIDESRVEKVFRIENEKLSRQFQEILENIPLEHMQLTSDIITYAKKNLNVQLNQSIYITLTDHINFAIQRQVQGIQLKNALLWEIKKCYHQEYLMGKYAINDTATEVRHLRNLGVSVLGVFAGEEKDLSTEKKIFGKDFAYIRDISNFSRIVGRYLIKQLDSDE